DLGDVCFRHENLFLALGAPFRSKDTGTRDVMHGNRHGRCTSEKPWNNPHVDACLSENEVAALIAGMLTPAKLEAAEFHLDRCVLCRELVAEALQPSERGRSRLPRPEHIGRYRVLREVGRGSMGTVYAAEDPDLGREIALKILRPASGDEH